jgi:hypothetical protein
VNMPLKVFIGYDPKEPIAFAVAMHSLLQHASKPLTIVPLVQSQLRSAGLYTRERNPLESTEFSFTRFLVPHLSGYKGLSLFVDCDVLFQADVFDLLLYPLVDPGKAVYVCQHDYTPKNGAKFLGQPQTAYPRKNWSSVMLFDNARCGVLGPDYVNSASGLALHRLHWVIDREIGALPLEWNVLADEEGQSPRSPQLVHYTRGGPWFPEYANCQFAERWLQALAEMHGQAVTA